MYGNLDIVKLLFDYGAPLSMVPPCSTPLYAAIEHQHFDITSFLLSKGADPNSTVVLSGTDSELSMSILDFAFAKKDERSVSLLLTCGADANNVDRAKLPPSVLDDLRKYDTEVKPLDDATVKQMDKLSNIAAGFKVQIDSSLRFIHSIDNLNRVDISSLIEKISKQYENIDKVMDILPEDIIDKRKDLLDSQFHKLIADDNSIFLSAFNHDFEEWEMFCESSIQRIQKRLESEKKPKVKQSLVAIINYVNRFKKAMDDDKEATLSPFLSSQDNVASNQCKRIELTQINRIYSRIKPIIETIYTLDQRFYQESTEIYDKLIKNYKQNLELINNLAQSQEYIRRIGLSDSTISQMESCNQQRLEKLTSNIKQIEEQKEKIKNISNTFSKKISKILLI